MNHQDRTTRRLETGKRTPVAETLAETWVEAHSDVRWMDLPFRLRVLLIASAVNLIEWHESRRYVA